MHLIKDTVDLTAYMDEEQPRHKVNRASDWMQAVIDHFHKPADTTPKIYLPWRKTHADFDFRPGEVTLWAGINSHGKSQLLGQVALGLMRQAQSVGIASLEMAPTATMARVQQQAWGGSLPAVDYIKQFHHWTDGKLWLYDHVGSSNPQTMLAVIRYTIDRFKVSHFIVDNLSKVIKGDQGEKVYNAQKDFVDGLCEIGNATGTHIHLVLHMRKGEKESDIPGKFDVKGSGAITDLVDNIFIVWRNKEKEANVREGNLQDQHMPDAILKLDKQRHRGIEGSYNLWFDPGSCQYLEHRSDIARRFEIDSSISLDEVEF